MNLLITTQAVDRTDPVLGFFHRWIEEFAKHCEQVTVICLREGEHALPDNVRVYSLGKEHGAVSKIRYAWRFLHLIRQLRNDYDAVFVHMNPEYVVLGGVWWRLWHKKIVLWYTHRQVTLKLRLAVFLAHSVATAAPESLRLKSTKVQVIGHGIDVHAFVSKRDGAFHDPLAIVSVGRITPIKRLEIVLEALALLTKKGVHAHVTFVGAPVMESDQKYKDRLLVQIQKLGIQDKISFIGAVPYADMPAIYAGQDISVNLAPTGGIDKAVLESMASGVLALAANRAFNSFFGSDTDMLLLDNTPELLAEKIQGLISMTNSEHLALLQWLVRTVGIRADISSIISHLVSLLV